jgi:hypothetical protein
MSDSYALRTSIKTGALPDVISSWNSAGAAWRPACAGSAGVDGGAFSVTISATADTVKREKKATGKAASVAERVATTGEYLKSIAAAPHSCGRRVTKSACASNSDSGPLSEALRPSRPTRTRPEKAGEGSAAQPRPAPQDEHGDCPYAPQPVSAATMDARPESPRGW